MRAPDNPDHVRPALRRAEAELARHLEEACDDHDQQPIEQQSTDELLQLEEELLAAARAADEAVRLRRKLGEGQPAAARSSPAYVGEAPEPEAPAGSRIREFRTASGSEWRVWEVRPGAAGRPKRPELYPVDYVEGWLAFELLDGEGRKRLPKFGPEWSEAPDAELERLLDQATEVPRRKNRSG